MTLTSDSNNSVEHNGGGDTYANTDVDATGRLQAISGDYCQGTTVMSPE